MGTAAAIPLVEPGIKVIESVECRNEFVVIHLTADPLKHRVDQVIMVHSGAERRDVDRSAHHSILKIVHGVGNVV